MPGLTTDLDLETLFAPVAGAKSLGLAVSGGPDSLALMLLAAEWARAEGRPALIVYSVDHGAAARGRRRGGDGRCAEAAALGLAGARLRWEGDKPETGIQAAARKARYRLIAEAMAADGAEYLLTAHHLGDQAETVLMRMAHGSGIEGLRGMEPFALVEGCRDLPAAAWRRAGRPRSGGRRGGAYPGARSRAMAIAITSGCAGAS